MGSVRRAVCLGGRAWQSPEVLPEGCEQAVRDAHEALYALDPARFVPEHADSLRTQLGSVRDRLRGTMAEDSATPVGRLVEQLEALPADDAPDAWEALRERAEPEYEAVAQELRSMGVRVPTLRPTNYRRSLVHMAAGLAVVAFVELVPQTVILWTASCALAFAILLETSRRVSPRANELMMKVLGPIAHPYERYRVNSASNYIAALFVLAWMRRPALGAVGVAVLALADPAASFIGRRWGKTKLIHGRTLQGSLMFVAVGVAAAFAALALFHLGELGVGTALLMALAAGVAGALAELGSGSLDDNLSVPVISAAAAWAVVGFA